MTVTPATQSFAALALPCYALTRMPDEISVPVKPKDAADLWCPNCARVVDDPLVCGDCSAVICRICGTPLESADELAFG
jgi:hypothetical protein